MFYNMYYIYIFVYFKNPAVMGYIINGSKAGATQGLAPALKKIKKLYLGQDSCAICSLVPYWSDTSHHCHEYLEPELTMQVFRELIPAAHCLQLWDRLYKVTRMDTLHTHWLTG